MQTPLATGAPTTRTHRRGSGSFPLLGQLGSEAVTGAGARLTIPSHTRGADPRLSPLPAAQDEGGPGRRPSVRTPHRPVRAAGAAGRRTEAGAGPPPATRQPRDGMGRARPHHGTGQAAPAASPPPSPTSCFSRRYPARRARPEKGEQPQRPARRPPR